MRFVPMCGGCSHGPGSTAGLLQQMRQEQGHLHETMLRGKADVFLRRRFSPRSNETQRPARVPARQRTAHSICCRAPTHLPACLSRFVVRWHHLRVPLWSSSTSSASTAFDMNSPQQSQMTSSLWKDNSNRLFRMAIAICSDSTSRSSKMKRYHQRI